MVQCRGMADSSDDCHQARHLMTASQSRKSARRTRRLSTGHRRARSDIQLASQIVRQFIMPDAIRRPFTAASPSANLLGRLDPNHKPHPRLSNLHNARGIILDINLKDGSGIELRHGLVAAGIFVPVIYMTGNDSPAVRAAAFQSGCLAYLTKPVSAKSLIEPLERAAAGSASNARAVTALGSSCETPHRNGNIVL